MSQEFRENQVDELLEEPTHVSGGWQRPENEEELLKELNDIIMGEDDEDDSYEEELRQRQYMAMERDRRVQRSRTGRMIGLFFTFISVILFVMGALNLYKGYTYQKSIKELENFKQDIGEQRSTDVDAHLKTIERILSKYMVAATVTDKTAKEMSEEAEKTKEIEEAKAKEVAEKAKKAQEEANQKQKELQEEQIRQAEVNNQENVSQNQVSSVPSAQNYQFILPSVDSAYIPESTIANMNAYQLYLARNEIFARHGRIFVNQDLKDYFGSQGWYQPTYDPATFDSWGLSMLNDYERANLELIQRYER